MVDQVQVLVTEAALLGVVVIVLITHWNHPSRSSNKLTLDAYLRENSKISWLGGWNSALAAEQNTCFWVSSIVCVTKFLING